MRRDLLLYGLLLGLLVWLVLAMQPVDAALPATTSFGWPQVTVQGLAVPATRAYPAFRAGEATPADGGAIGVGGVQDRLRLRAVEVSLGEGAVVLHAAAGELEAGELRLTGPIRCKGRLTADAVAFRDGEAMFDGVAVFHGPSGQEATVDLRLSRVELARRLAR